MFTTAFVGQLPVLLACVVACIIVLARWRQGAQGSIWAMLGFGLALLLAIVIPVVQTSVQIGTMQGNHSAEYRHSLFTGLAFLWAVLRAVSYGFLLIAMFAGRPQPTASHLPPLRQP